MRYNSADVSYLVIISYQRPISAGDEIKRIRLSNIINMFVKTNTDLLSLFCNPPSGLSFRNAEPLQNICRTFAEGKGAGNSFASGNHHEQKSPESELNLKIISVKLNRFLSSVGRATDS